MIRAASRLLHRASKENQQTRILPASLPQCPDLFQDHLPFDSSPPDKPHKTSRAAALPTFNVNPTYTSLTLSSEYQLRRYIKARLDDDVGKLLLGIDVGVEIGLARRNGRLD